jgi:DNA-binding HxlR family transcriptional regulator
MRVGARVLGLLAVPLNGMIVRALGDGPMFQADLRSELGNPAETTLRGHLVRLEELGAVRRKMRVDGTSSVRSELTEKGVDLLAATRALEDWLSRAPQGPVQLGTVQAKGAVKALLGGWDSTLLRALAARPLTLTQLDRLIGAFSYPALERRLTAMRSTGLAESTANNGGTPYTVTPWTRQGVGPIIAAALFERLHFEDVPMSNSIDIEAAFLLATPISTLPPDADGVCSLVAETGNGSQTSNGRHAGVEVAVDRGRIESCVTRLEPNPRNWAMGSTIAWLEALVHGRPRQLRIGGDRRLALSLIQGMHEQLFSPIRECA